MWRVRLRTRTRVPARATQMLAARLLRAFIAAVGLAVCLAGRCRSRKTRYALRGRFGALRSFLRRCCRGVERVRSQASAELADVAHLGRLGSVAAVVAVVHVLWQRRVKRARAAAPQLRRRALMSTGGYATSSVAGFSRWRRPLMSPSDRFRLLRKRVFTLSLRRKGEGAAQRERRPEGAPVRRGLRLQRRQRAPRVLEQIALLDELRPDRIQQRPQMESLLRASGGARAARFKTCRAENNSSDYSRDSR